MATALFALSYLKSALSAFIRDEAAQDTFEYVLIIGGIVVAVIIAVATPVGGALIDAVIQGVCGAINTIDFVNVECGGIGGGGA